MELLVSVRSAAEVGEALAGGANIIDAKEPRRGSIGAVSPSVLAEIAARVPGGISLSVALGDLTSVQQVAAAVGSLPVSGRLAPLYLKLGFAGVRSASRIEKLIAAALVVPALTERAARVVAVAYADARQAGTAPADEIRRAAAGAGAAGILLDTYGKDGLGLLDWTDPEALEGWVTDAHRAGLTSALAGSLGPADLDVISAAGPDVVGVRGAACEGGRDGRVSQCRVRALRQRLDATSGSVQGLKPTMIPSGSRNA